MMELQKGNNLMSVEFVFNSHRRDLKTSYLPWIYIRIALSVTMEFG